MEKRTLEIQLLLEIALQQKHEGNIEEILNHALPLYLRKLNCFLAVVVADGELLNIIPKAMKNHPGWLEVFAEIKTFTNQNTEQFAEIIHSENHYYVYPLARFGHIVLGRKLPFSEDFKKDIGKVINHQGVNLLRVSEEQRIRLLQGLIDNSTDAIQIAEEDGRLYYINKVAEERLGIKQEECNSYSVSDFESTLKDPKNWEHHLQELREKKELILEGENIHQQSGIIFPVEVTVKHLVIAGKGFVVAISRDITQRKAQQQQLLETKQKLESIFNEMSDVIWSVSLPGYKAIFVSPSVEKLYGISVNEWMQDNTWWEKAIHPEDKAVIAEIYKEIEKKGQFSKRYRIVTGNGEVKWVRNRAKLIFDENGQPIRLDGVVMDRTPQYEAEDKLFHEMRLQEILIDIASTYINLDLAEVEPTINESLRKLGLFVNADRAYIFDYDFTNNSTSNTYEWCNDGVDPEISNLQKIPIDYFPQWVEQHRKGEAFYVQDVLSLPDDGEHGLRGILEPQGIKSLIAIPMIQQSELIGFVGFDSVKEHHNYSEKEKRLLFLFAQMLINIRNRQRWEKQLTVQEEKYRNIIANMNLGLVEVDNDDVVLFANQTFCNISGYSLQELKGRKAAELLLGPDQRKIIEQKHKDREKGILDSYEIEVRNKQGEKRWWFVSGAPNYNDKGQLTGSIGIHLDITAQKKLEQELEQAKSFAEAAAKAKELFLANMSHEIRTPLNVIIGMIRQLSREKLTDQHVYYVKQAESSASHLLTILNNILDIAKIESGELQLYKNDFALTSLVHNIHSILYTQAREKNLEFRLHIGQDVVPVLIGDEVRIRQVLINLLGNAIKFTERGSISILVHVLENSVDYQVIGFEVSDTGIGMSEAFVKRIFEKFTQEQDAADRRFEGTGLGMSIANDLVKLMGGTLEVESAKDKGTHCRFSLKLTVGDQSKLSSKSIRVEKASFPDSSVLLVEDNEMNRFIAVQSLEHLGCRVAEAENGQIALQLLKNKQFDLILMDIQMPVMDGLEATQIIRQKLQSDTPIIALTANAFRHDIEAYLAKGMNDFIIKPYDEQDFLRKVAHYLNLSRLASLKNKNENNAGNQVEYNLAFLEKMSQGNQAFINKMLNIFCNLATSSIDAFETALETGDIETINKTAHKIKPSIEQMGIAVLKDPVLKLEKYDLEKASKKELQALVENTNASLRTVVKQIKDKELN